ncbi:MAG: GDYXXLXY domain-containing protein [bacterium]
MTGKLRFYGFVTVLASMVIFLLGLAGYHYSVKTTGRVVRLATEPVDPRSLFRGDYVQLRYDINTIQAREHEVSDGDRVYVTLQRSDTVWEAQYIQRQYELS